MEYRQGLAMEVDDWNGGYMEVFENNETGELDELLTQTLTPRGCRVDRETMRLTVF